MPEGEDFPDELFVPNYTILSWGNNNSWGNCLFLSSLQMPTNTHSCRLVSVVWSSADSLRIRNGLMLFGGPLEVLRSSVAYSLFLNSPRFIFQSTKSLFFGLSSKWLYVWHIWEPWHRWLCVTFKNKTKCC